MKKNLFQVLAALLICAMGLMTLTACGSSAPAAAELNANTGAEAEDSHYSDPPADNNDAAEIEALGHAWEAHTERVKTGSALHTICADCGFDFSAAGYTSDQAASHSEVHVLADENATGRRYSTMVDIYENVTTYTCTHCGVTRTES